MIVLNHKLTMTINVLFQLAFGIAMMLPLNNDVRFGLLCVACVPGGGLGHVAVILGDADLPLSLAMNLISIVAMLGNCVFLFSPLISIYI